MAAGAPKGSAPEKFGRNPDANDSGETSTPEVTTETVEATAGAKTPEADPKESLNSEDLKALEDNQKVPYNRFKEVNDKMRSLESTSSKIEEKHSDQIRNLTAQYEAKLAAASTKSSSNEDDFGIVYEEDTKHNKEVLGQMATLQKQLDSLKATNTATQTKAEIDGLHKKYPKADVNAVLGWAKAKPGRNLDDLMELSHRTNVEMVETEIRAILEKKKKSKANALPLSNVNIKLKDSERPKSMKEAHRAAKQFLES